MRRVALAVLPFMLTACYADIPSEQPARNREAVKALVEASEALHNGDLALATNAAREAWHLDPDYQDGAWLYACLLGRTGDLDTALKVCADLVARHPDCVQGHLLEGILWDLNGNRDSANGAYDRALAVFAAADVTSLPAPAARLYEALTVFLRHGKLEGVGAINRVIAEFPDYSLATYVKTCIQDRNRTFLLRWFSESQTGEPSPRSGDPESELSSGSDSAA